VALDSVHIRVWDVNAAASTLHNAAGGHHRARHSTEFAVDDIADEQLVRREVVLAVGVIPDMCVAVLLVRLVLGISPLAHPLLGCITVPFTVGISQIEVLEACDGH
jgi:hypothetical protein